MEMDVIRQLEEQMKIFGIQVIRLRTGDPEETEFDLGLRRALGIRRDSGADLKMMADLLEEDTLYFIRDVFGVHYICLRLPGQDAGDETACFLHIGPYLTGDRETVWEETVKKRRSLCLPAAGTAALLFFSAYHVASYVNRVAEAGKAVYDLPMTANCWLDKGEKPGKYPSGGPVARMMEVWKFAAPAIDVIAPDIYVQNFCEICDAYTKMGNPLFIPETATHSHVGPRLVYTVGHHHAICFAPFGFEDMGQEFSGTQSYLFGVDTSDPLLQTPQNVEEYRWYNQTLAAMMSMLADAYGTDRLQAVITEVPDKNRMMFGSYGFMVLFDLPIIQRKDGVCLALQVSEDTFYLIANACMLAPFSADPEKPNVDLLALEEGYFEDGKWVMTRRLNGDESASMNFGEPTLLKIKLFSYK